MPTAVATAITASGKIGATGFHCCYDYCHLHLRWQGALAPILWTGRTTAPLYAHYPYLCWHHRKTCTCKRTITCVMYISAAALCPNLQDGRIKCYRLVSRDGNNTPKAGGTVPACCFYSIRHIGRIVLRNWTIYAGLDVIVFISLWKKNRITNHVTDIVRFRNVAHSMGKWCHQNCCCWNWWWHLSSVSPYDRRHLHSAWRIGYTEQTLEGMISITTVIGVLPLHQVGGLCNLMAKTAEAKQNNYCLFRKPENSFTWMNAFICTEN